MSWKFLGEDVHHVLDARQVLVVEEIVNVSTMIQSLLLLLSFITSRAL
jgi:hypothetical protein